MSTWAERVHRRAADFSSVVTSCGHPGSSAPTYPYRLEKVKFGVSLDEVCKNDNIPGPLLVLILKLNKESPNRRDVFRAPGHQGAMKKLIHFLQAGRLVNVDNYSVYTIASVLKKFLRKIPNGIFGRSGENELFAIIELSNEAEQNERLHKLFTSLPKYTQHLLVLLFGTFRVIASNADHAGTGMTSEALGVSVAPSFFQSCVSDGKTARMEDVLKFKVATKIMKYIIDKFATHDLFGRDNYEYYARVTGRILKVQDEWICSFQYPPPPRGKLAQQKYALQHSLEAEKTWLQCQCERWGLLGNIRLSNSAESVQYPVRRPSTRRILLGANIPRQYPLRSSLRRHKEKQVGTTNSSASCCTSSSSSSNAASMTRPVSTAGCFLSNSSNSEALAATKQSNECCAMESTATIIFKGPRV
ncbi:rho GTPase-activating protein 20 isoform X4 [Stomoxys calcitrans]|uniref:Rho-GAP domain-containing protein n=1 Tax=Stomoxys calcitrans TaxID=35570 RepID=A0A1I8Q280_STOCA|nr:rho GTPase-activating protein 20 isoform X4 [Stomoxys calcitrans]